VLLASDLRPDVVVLGIDSISRGLASEAGAFNPGFVEYVKRHDWRNVAIAIRDWPGSIRGAGCCRVGRVVAARCPRSVVPSIQCTCRRRRAVTVRGGDDQG
jgi:hypothetical protein